MGYTHYWSTRDCIEIDRAGYGAALPILQDIARRHRTVLCYEWDEPDREPRIGLTEIHLNGKNEEGHETFLFHLQPPAAMWAFAKAYGQTAKDVTRLAHGSFCKTARKPYDLPVCEMLLVLKAYCPNLQVDSDGFLCRDEDGTRTPELDESWPQAMENVTRYGIIYQIGRTSRSDTSKATQLQLDTTRSIIQLPLTGMGKA